MIEKAIKPLALARSFIARAITRAESCCQNRGGANRTSSDDLLAAAHKFPAPARNAMEMFGTVALPSSLARALAEHDSTAWQQWLQDTGGNVCAVWADNVTLLHLAASSGFESLLDLLLEDGAGRPLHVDEQTGSGVTPLMCATSVNDPASVRSLLRAGAELGLRDVKGRTALDVAKELGHSACARAIEEHLRVQDAARNLEVVRIANETEAHSKQGPRHI